MRIDPQTLLFEDLSADEADQLEELATALTLGTRQVSTEEPLFAQWFQVMGMPAAQVLLVFGTVFPSRALLSVLRYHRAQA